MKVEWSRVEKGVAELVGIPERVRRDFSTRRVEIERAMASAGSRGRDAAQVATLATRRGKNDSLTADQLFREWRARADRVGLTSGNVRDLCGRATHEPIDFAAASRVALGPSGLTQDRASFGEREVLQGLCAVARGGALVSEVEAAAQRLLARPEVVMLRGETRAVETQYTTSELLERERQVLVLATRQRHAGRALVPAEKIRAALDGAAFLTDEQRNLVRRLAADGDGVAVVVGRAGTGKTTALVAACDAWRSAGISVVGCAVARRAAKELHDRAGIEASSVHAFLSNRRPLSQGTVVIIDEASMLGTRAFAEIMERTEAARGKVVVVGDPSQLQAIEAGGAVKALMSRLDPIVLKDNRRRRHAWEREAVAMIRDGAADTAISLYETHGRLHIGTTGDDVMRSLLDRWRRLDDPAETLIIAHRTADVRELNGRARAICRARNQLGDTEPWGVAGPFAVGDVVVIKQNSKRLDVRNGERGIVAAVNTGARTLAIAIGDRIVQLDADFLASRNQAGRPAIEHGYATTAHASQGVTCRHALVLTRDDAYREWAYSAVTRATEGSHLFIVSDQGRERDDFAPRAPRRNEREELAAALTRQHADELAIERLTPRSSEHGLSR